MNATTFLQQQKHVKRHNAHTRVPDIAQFPEKYHTLFVKIGQSSMVQRFEAITTSKGLELKVYPRKAERFNIVAHTRFLNLFAGFPKTRFPLGYNKRPLTIIIPE